MAVESTDRLEAVLELARRYNYDAPHSHQVECLAGTLFMEMAPYHNLKREDRKLLEYAAILHDIGYFVSAQGHHRHALMMILTEPLTCFTRDEVKIIANIARYHRKALPSPDHTVYGTLSESDRWRVNCLAALLRVADALDRSHKAQIKELTCDVTEDTVILNLVSDQDLPAEIASVARRDDLFRSVFKKGVRVDVQLPKLATPQAVYQMA